MILKTAALGAAAALATAGMAQAAEYAAAVSTVEIAKPPAQVIAKTDGFCAIGAWLKASCEITAGTDREVGAVRKIANRVEEVLVAKTPSSYTYAMTGVDNLYHGTVAYLPGANGGTRVVYTVMQDISKLPTPEARTGWKAMMEKRLDGWLAAMKTAAEG